MIVRKALEKRFGPLPDALVQRISAAEMPALDAALDQANAIRSLDEFTLKAGTSD